MLYKYKFTSLLLLCLLHFHTTYSQTCTEVSLKQKVGQLIITAFEGDNLTSETEFLLCDYNIGGVILYKKHNRLSNCRKIASLCHSISSLPLTSAPFIAVDQEGGRVQALKKSFKEIPPARVVAETLKPKEAEELYYQSALELKSVGINLNFAPDVDVNTNPSNPVIGNRSFGNSSETVITYAKAAMNGYQKAGIASCIKHFPGHGDTSTDSHINLSTFDKDYSLLQKEHMVVFKNLCKDAEMVMTAHILVPQVDKTNCASCSPFFLKDILRQKFGYEGIIISDSLTMKGILEKNDNDIGKSAVCALKAGCDMVIIGGIITKGQVFDISLLKQVHNAVLEALDNGELKEEEIENSYLRVQKLKAKIHLLKD